VAGVVRSGLEAAGWLALKCALAFDLLLFSVKFLQKWIFILLSTIPKFSISLPFLFIDRLNLGHVSQM
jgi:hypothetical protein